MPLALKVTSNKLLVTKWNKYNLATYLQHIYSAIEHLLSLHKWILLSSFPPKSPQSVWKKEVTDIQLYKINFASHLGQKKIVSLCFMQWKPYLVYRCTEPQHRERLEGHQRPDWGRRPLVDLGVSSTSMLSTAGGWPQVTTEHEPWRGDHWPVLPSQVTFMLTTLGTAPARHS